MLILVGPSASGKTEIAKALVNHFNFKKIITSTTRPKREHEVDGIDYHFLDEAMFNTLKNENKFVETSLYQGYQYGLQKKDVISYGIVILDPNGANSIYQNMNDNMFIIYVESNPEIRRYRMRQRGDDELSMKKRIETDDNIFNIKQLQHVDYIVNNDHPHVMEATLQCLKHYQNWLKKGV
jgi:guanylate kinase